MQLSVLRWMMSKRSERSVSLRAAGSDDRARYTSRIGRKTCWRRVRIPGTTRCWARYSVDELNQQAKAGDRPYPGDLRSIFWATPHDPDEDFHWTRQISSWTLPGLLGMFGHSYTLRQLWLCHCCRAQDRSGDWSTGPWARSAFLTDTPAEVMQLPVQDVADSVCDERISVPVESLQQFPEVYKALMDRIGGPGALAEVKVNWRCNTKQWWVGAVPDSVAPSIYRKLGYTNNMIKLMGLDPSAPGCRTGADGPEGRRGR